MKTVTSAIINNYFDNLAKNAKKGQGSFEREESFGMMRKIFEENHGKSNNEFVAISLYAFLANWGMMHKSKLMLGNNFKCLVPVVDILYRNYDKLENSDPLSSERDRINVFNVSEDINKILDNLHIRTHDTLCTKILLGTFGCVIAFDTKVIGNLKSKKLLATFTKTNYEKIASWVEDKVNFSLVPSDYNIPVSNAEYYTKARMLDIYLFNLK